MKIISWYKYIKINFLKKYFCFYYKISFILDYFQQYIFLFYIIEKAFYQYIYKQKLFNNYL